VPLSFCTLAGDNEHLNEVYLFRALKQSSGTLRLKAQDNCLFLMPTEGSPLVHTGEAMIETETNKPVRIKAAQAFILIKISRVACRLKTFFVKKF